MPGATFKNLCPWPAGLTKQAKKKVEPSIMSLFPSVRAGLPNYAKILIFWIAPREDIFGNECIQWSNSSNIPCIASFVKCPVSHYGIWHKCAFFRQTIPCGLQLQNYALFFKNQNLFNIFSVNYCCSVYCCIVFFCLPINFYTISKTPNEIPQKHGMKYLKNTEWKVIFLMVSICEWTN